MKRRTFVTFAIAAASSIALVFAMSDAPAQTRGRAPRHAASARSTPPKSAPARGASIDAGAPAATKAASSPGAASTAAVTADDAGVVEVKRSDGGAQTIKFGELEIEGRLKSPQLVYFLRRVRAEFAAGDLGHRSFMRELSETKKDPSF